MNELFFRMLENFIKERQALAQKHHTPCAEEFARRRDTEGKKDFYYTILDGVYQEYNSKPLAILAEHMRGMSLDKKSSEKKSKKIEDTYLDRSSRFDIEIFEGEELAKLKWLARIDPKKELPNDFPVHLCEKRESPAGLNAEEEQTLRQALKKLKETQPEVYKLVKMNSFFFTLQQNFPSPKKIPQSNGTTFLVGEEKNLKSFFVLGTARLLVKGKMCATSQYLTWLYRDFAQHPVDRMLKCSTVMLIHPDNFLINDLLQEIASLFAKAVFSKKDDRKELTNNVGIMHDYWDNTMPCERTSASIGEIFAGSVYGSHDLEVAYDKKRLVALEAATTPRLSHFMKNYDSMIKLTPKKLQE